MDERDLALRNLTYRLFVELGQAPTAAELSRTTVLTVTAVQSGWRRLHDLAQAWWGH